MKTRQIFAFAALLAAGATSAMATDWYVNDNDTTLDVYCSRAGNDANDGLSTNSPKLSISAVATSADFKPGDTLFIDTGTYNLGNAPAVFTRSGTQEARITVKGSPKGTRITSDASWKLQVQASFIDFSDLRVIGEGRDGGLQLVNAVSNTFNRVDVLVAAPRSVGLSSANYNLFHHGVLANSTYFGIGETYNYMRGNDLFSMTIVGSGSAVYDSRRNTTFRRVENCIFQVDGAVFLVETPTLTVKGNLFRGKSIAPEKGYASLDDFQLADPELRQGNVIGKAVFADMEAGDYHLSSPYGHWKETRTGEGYLTGGTWEMDSTMEVSPGIDFGYDNEWSSWTNEPGVWGDGAGEQEPS